MAEAKDLFTALASAVAPVLVTAVGGIVVAIYQARAQRHELALEAQKAAAAASAQGVETNARLDQAARQQSDDTAQKLKDAQSQLLRELAPKVVRATGNAVNCPLALGLWQSIYPGTSALVLERACPQVVDDRASSTGEWVVQTGTDFSVSDGCSEVRRVTSAGFDLVRLFRSEGRWVTAVGSFTSKANAEPVAAAARIKLHQGGATVVNPADRKWEPESCPPK
jgi:hypothetical protein